MNDLEKVDVGAGEPQTSGQERAPKKSKKGGGGRALLSFLLFILLVLVVLVVLDRVVGINIFTSETERKQQKVEDFLANTGAWHAVFLTNGQVYFGQFSESDAQFSTLRDVYYLQLQQVQSQQQGQPSVKGEGESQVVPAPQPQPPQLTLIKFGTELHGPKDFMKINRDHILFWEELKSDSRVVQAISQYKESQ